MMPSVNRLSKRRSASTQGAALAHTTLTAAAGAVVGEAPTPAREVNRLTAIRRMFLLLPSRDIGNKTRCCALVMLFTLVRQFRSGRLVWSQSTGTGLG